jgi:hypothetical protein
MTSKMDRIALTALLTALGAIVAANPASAQEGAPAAGGDAVQAPAPSSDVEPFTPRRGPAGLARRANLKALIANASGRAAGVPSAAAGAAPSRVRIRMDAGQRNAIGVVVPGTTAPAIGIIGNAAPSGNKPANIGTPVANIAGTTQRLPAPAASSVLHATGINGTTMGRMITSPGSIGGPAKDHSGINGTSMRSRH